MSNAADIELATARSLPIPSFLNLTAVAVTAVVIAAALSPGVDLAVARMFYLGDRQFLGEGEKIVQLLRFILMSVYAGACVGVVAGLIAARMNRDVWLSLTFSQWLFFALCLGVGPGVVANLALKDQSGRARPGQIVEFGGTKQFSAAFAPSDQCLRNCSFVSGEASSMFVVFFAAASVWRRRWRALAAAGLAVGGIAGLIRMIQGAHFLTDVVFAAVFMAMTVTAIQYLFEAIAASARSGSLAHPIPHAHNPSRISGAPK